jgi:hypothetical protein
MVYGFGYFTAIGAAGYTNVGAFNDLQQVIFWYGQDTTQTLRPHAVAYDKVNDRVVLSCDSGLISIPNTTVSGPNANGTWGPNPTANYILDHRGASDELYGFELTGDDASQGLLTKQGYQSIYHWTSASGIGAVTAFDFSYGTPVRIHKGPDGKYYVLIMENGVSIGQGAAVFWSSKYRVARFDFNTSTKKLINPVLMVNTMPTKPASFITP